MGHMLRAVGVRAIWLSCHRRACRCRRFPARPAGGCGARSRSAPGSDRRPRRCARRCASGRGRCRCAASSSRCSACRPSRRRRRWLSVAVCSRSRMRSFSASSVRAACWSPSMNTLVARCRLSSSALVHVGDLRQAFLREGQPLLDLLGGDLAQALVEDVADVLEIDGEGKDVRAALGIGLAQAVLAADGGQVQLHRVVQLVERVVHGRRAWSSSLRSSFCSASRNMRSIALDDVDHAQHFACGIGQSDAGRAEHRGVDVLRPAGIVGDGLRRQQLRAQPRQRVEQADEDGRQRQVEQRVEVGHLACGARLQRRPSPASATAAAEWRPGSRCRARSGCRAPGAAPPCWCRRPKYCGMTLPRLAPSTRASAAAGGTMPLRRQRHHQQHHGDARIGGPGQQRGDRHVDDRVAGQHGEQLAQGLGLLHRLDGGDDQDAGPAG